MRPEDRQTLIRGLFEAMRDITWAETVWPNFRGLGVDDLEMREWRVAWNARTDGRDWSWWQSHAAQYSDEQLKATLADAIERGNALWMMQRRNGSELQGSSNNTRREYLFGAGRAAPAQAEHAVQSDLPTVGYVRGSRGMGMS